MNSVRRFLLVTIAVGIFSAAGCHTAPKVQPVDTRAADEATIRANSIAWNAAVNARDTEKELAIYTDDAAAFEAGGPIQTTPAERRAGIEASSGDQNWKITWKTTKVELAKSGEMAYEYGAYRYVATGKDGTTTTTPGKYVLVWKKQADGAWKVAVDIDNPDGVPAPVAAAPAKAKPNQK